MSNKLQAKDLINLGLFTVLYFVIGCCVAIPIGFVPIFLPILGALWSLITGIPFMLFLTRVKKFGMVIGTPTLLSARPCRSFYLYYRRESGKGLLRSRV